MNQQHDVRELQRAIETAKQEGADLLEHLRDQRPFIAMGSAVHQKILNVLKNDSMAKLLRQAAHRVNGVASYDVGHRYETLMGIVSSEMKGLVLASLDVREHGTGDVLGTLDFVVFQGYLGKTMIEKDGKYECQERTPRDVMVFYVPDPEKLNHGDSKAVTEFKLGGCGFIVAGGLRSAPLTFAARGEEAVLSDVRDQLRELLKEKQIVVEGSANEENASPELVKLSTSFSRVAEAA